MKLPGVAACLKRHHMGSSSPRPRIWYRMLALLLNSHGSKLLTSDGQVLVKGNTYTLPSIEDDPLMPSSSPPKQTQTPMPDQRFHTPRNPPLQTMMLSLPVSLAINHHLHQAQTSAYNLVNPSAGGCSQFRSSYFLPSPASIT